MRAFQKKKRRRSEQYFASWTDFPFHWRVTMSSPKGKRPSPKPTLRRAVQGLQIGSGMYKELLVEHKVLNCLSGNWKFCKLYLSDEPFHTYHRKYSDLWDHHLRIFFACLKSTLYFFYRLRTMQLALLKWKLKYQEMEQGLPIVAICSFAHLLLWKISKDVCLVQLHYIPFFCCRLTK